MTTNIFFLGADPTLKDISGHQAIEYAGSTNIKDFLQDKMETVIASLMSLLNLKIHMRLPHMRK